MSRLHQRLTSWDSLPARRLSVAAGVISLGCACLTAWAAPSPPAAPPGIRVNSSVTRTNLDPLSLLMLQQPPIDTESPVTADAEFDPPIATLGSRITYRVLLTAMSEVIEMPEKLPTPPGITLIPGGHGQRFNAVGGKYQPQTTFNFRVQANATGTYTMPSFSVVAYHKPVTVPAASIAIVPPGTAQAIEAPRLEVELPAGDFYVGQSLHLKVRLLAPGAQGVAGLTQPQVIGDTFLVDNTFARQRRELTTRGGIPYATIVHELFVIPIREGAQTLTVQAQAYINRTLTNPPGKAPFYNPLLDSDPVNLLVKRLPKAGELPGFNGAIGSFQLESPTTSTPELRAGDPLTLTVKVKGQGNITRLVPPKLAFVRDWQTFPPMLDLAPPNLVHQRGWCSFSYTLIPLSDRLQATPAIPFSYFDPQKGVFVDLTIPPVPLKVNPAPAGTVLPAPLEPTSAMPNDPFAPLDRNQVPAMTGLMEKPGRQVSNLVPLQRRPWFLVLQLVPVVGLGGLWAWDRRRRYLAQHPEIIRKRRARRALRRHWRLAHRAFEARDARGYVMAAVNALREACAPREAANPQALVCADVLHELPLAERQGQEGTVVQTLFAAADALQFVEQAPDREALFTLRPAVEQLLAKLRQRL